jgi:hypothetical protein
LSRRSDKPLAELARFAAALGWSDLRMCEHRGSGEEAGVATTWYESGPSDGVRNDFFLQITEAPSGQALTYVGAVYAMRYRLCSGWHPFTLRWTAEEQAAEVAQVDVWLHRRWYETAPMRREFRRLRPECAGYSWTRIRREGRRTRRQRVECAAESAE